MRSIIEMLFIIIFAFNLDNDEEENFEECFDDYYFIE